MSARLYSLATIARRPGISVELQVVAELELVENGKHKHWWFVTKVNGRRVGDYERFPFTCIERPPLEIALREVGRRVAACLGAKPQDVCYQDLLEWKSGCGQ